MFQTISEQHGRIQTAFTEDERDEFRDFFFLQRFVQNFKRQTGRQNFRQECTTNRRLITLETRGVHFCFRINIHFSNTRGDARGQSHFFGFVRTIHFVHVRKEHAFANTVGFRTRRIVQTQDDIL